MTDDDIFEQARRVRIVDARKGVEPQQSAPTATHLRVGDVVLYQTVGGLRRQGVVTAFGVAADEVLPDKAIRWDELHDRVVMVDLDDGHWIYPSQIERG